MEGGRKKGREGRGKKEGGKVKGGRERETVSVRREK